LVLPKLRLSSCPSKFIIPNSALHYLGPTKELIPDQNKSIFSRLNDPNKADMTNRYQVSKLLIIYVVREIASRIKASGKPVVIVNTPNPSHYKSDLVREIEGPTPPDFLARSTEIGSRTLVNGVLAVRPAGPMASILC
jgi:hypothetical protein